MNTGYFYIEFEAEPKTIALDNGISLVVEYVASVDIFSLQFPEAPNRRFVLATSETNALFYSNNLQHLYVERTANHIGVWLNGYLLTSSGVTLYKANTIAVPTQHNFNINAVKQCRTFNRALTGFEIARLMFQDSTKYTPYPEFGTTVSPLYATSGNAIYINFNPLAKGYKKAIIIKPERLLISGEYITVSETHINFNTSSILNVKATTVIGLGNVSTQEIPLTLEPIVSYPNSNIELTKTNASSWSSGRSVSASSQYAGYSSATLIAGYTKWSIDTANTTVTNLSSPNIIASNTNPLKIKVNDSVVTLPAGLVYKQKSIIPG